MPRPLSRIDRASHLRTNADRLNTALDDPDTLLLPVWRNKNLIATEDEPHAVLLTVREAGALLDAPHTGELVWLGLLDGADCFAIDLSEHPSPAAHPALSGRGDFNDLRMVGGLIATEYAELCAYGRALLRWHRHHRYCGLCGSRTRPREGGHVRECEKDGERHFPRTDPAIMVLIEHRDRCLLARQAAWPEGMYSVLAGFVEPGETLEQAAAREAMEEVGLAVRDVSYFRSQPWPFPASLMIGFTARSDGDEVRVDDDEIETARWFGREELSNPRGFFYPPPFSLAHHLIRGFIDGGRSG